MSKAEEVLAYLKVKLADTEVSKETYDNYIIPIWNWSFRCVRAIFHLYQITLFLYGIGAIR